MRNDLKCSKWTFGGQGFNIFSFAFWEASWSHDYADLSFDWADLFREQVSPTYCPALFLFSTWYGIWFSKQ